MRGIPQTGSFKSFRCCHQHNSGIGLRGIRRPSMQFTSMPNPHDDSYPRCASLRSVLRVSGFLQQDLAHLHLTCIRVLVYQVHGPNIKNGNPPLDTTTSGVTSPSQSMASNLEHPTANDHVAWAEATQTIPGSSDRT